VKICFASHNAHKIRELNHMLEGVHQVYGLEDLGIKEDIPETGKTFEENSRIKAKHVYDQHRVPVFADDSGLMVEALDGEPGVFSARYAGPEKNDEKNIDLLLKRLGESPNREATFKTVITYIDPAGNEHQFSGTIDGSIRLERSGMNGFGYDPVFQPKGYEVTFAELSPEEKNKISHRAMAVKKLIKHLHLAQ
jgi:XTP/dITP diphosphohydrolase